MVDFPDVLKQLGVDIYNGHGWENFDINQQTHNCFNDENAIEKFIYFDQKHWLYQKLSSLRFKKKYCNLDDYIKQMLNLFRNFIFSQRNF